jgi:hypothetical protein
MTTSGADLQMKTSIKESKILQPAKSDITDLTLYSYSGSTVVVYAFNYKSFNAVFSLSFLRLYNIILKRVVSDYMFLR